MKPRGIAPDQLSAAHFEALRDLRSPHARVPIQFLNEILTARLARMHRGAVVLTRSGRALLASGSFKLWRSVA